MTGVLPPRGTGFLRPANWVPSPDELNGMLFPFTDRIHGRIYITYKYARQRRLQDKGGGTLLFQDLAAAGCGHNDVLLLRLFRPRPTKGLGR